MYVINLRTRLMSKKLSCREASCLPLADDGGALTLQMCFCSWGFVSSKLPKAASFKDSNQKQPSTQLQLLRFLHTGPRIAQNPSSTPVTQLPLLESVAPKQSRVLPLDLFLPDVGTLFFWALPSFSTIQRSFLIFCSSFWAVLTGRFDIHIWYILSIH